MIPTMAIIPITINIFCAFFIFPKIFIIHKISQSKKLKSDYVIILRIIKLVNKLKYYIDNKL